MNVLLLRVDDDVQPPEAQKLAGAVYFDGITNDPVPAVVVVAVDWRAAQLIATDLPCEGEVAPWQVVSIRSIKP